MTGSYRKIPIDAFLTPEIAKQLGYGKTVMQPPPRQAAPWWDEDEAEIVPQKRQRYIHRSWNFLPTEVSTCRGLALRDAWLSPVYDVNGYYRSLGIGWPFRPTKRELMEAYRDTDGAASEFATYAFKRLLDKEFRERYDARPPNQPMDDKYRWIELKRKAAKWAAVETLKRGRAVDSGEFVPPDIRVKMEADTRRQQEGEDVREKKPTLTWGFGYFLWDAVRVDQDRLAEWQSMLLAACWARGIKGSFAVGVMAEQGHQAARVHHEGHDIAFLDEDTEPRQLLADALIQSVLDTPFGREFDPPITTDLDSGLTTRDEEIIPDDSSADTHFTTPEELLMSDDELDFTTGGLQAAEHAKAAAAARKAQYGNAYITQYLQDDGDKVIARFLTDEPQLIETLQHGMVPCKPPPKDKPADKGWPETLSAVCRYTPVGADRHKAYSSCYICDAMKDEKGKKLWAGTRLWGLAAIREPVIGTEAMVEAKQIQPHMVGQQVSYQDKTEEVDELDKDRQPTGKKVMRKVIVIVNMAQANFWSPLMTNRVFFGTIVDRDYLIVRKGAKKTQKVQYEFVALNPVSVKHPESGEVVTLDLRDPKLAAAYEGQAIDLPKLRKHVSRLCSETFYNRFFDPRVEVPYLDDDETSTASTNKGAGTPASQQAQQAGQSLTSEPTTGVTAEQLAAMRAGLLAANPAPSNGQSADTAAVVSPL